jgi:hypothetical protein
MVVSGHALNAFLESASEFVGSLADCNEMQSVARKIVHRMLHNREAPLHAAEHPFRKYANFEKSFYENMAALAYDIMNEIQDAHLRGYVVSFFHSGGANYQVTKELIEDYFDFVDGCSYAEEGIDDNLSDIDNEQGSQHNLEEEQEGQGQGDEESVGSEESEVGEEENENEEDSVGNENDEEDEEEESEDEEDVIDLEAAIINPHVWLGE